MKLRAKGSTGAGSETTHSVRLMVAFDTIAIRSPAGPMRLRRFRPCAGCAGATMIMIVRTQFKAAHHIGPTDYSERKKACQRDHFDASRCPVLDALD